MLAEIALTMLREDLDLREDARRFAKRGNSVLGSVLALTRGVPRVIAENAVLEALARLDGES